MKEIALKYVMMHGPDGHEFPVFCLAPMLHQQLADAWRKQLPGAVPVSAGFVRFPADGPPELIGGSTSLALTMRPADVWIFRTFSGLTADFCARPPAAQSATPFPKSQT